MKNIVSNQTHFDYDVFKMCSYPLFIKNCITGTVHFYTGISGGLPTYTKIASVPFEALSPYAILSYKDRFEYEILLEKVM